MLDSKWVLLLLPLLRKGPVRNGELLRNLPGISQKMLTQTLRDLEKYKIVHRRNYSEVPPRVEYSLTSIVLSLAKLMSTVDDWVIEHYYDRTAPTRRSKRTTL